MRISLTLITLLLAGAAFTQEKSGVWKWVDKDGVTHYSDQPGPGAVKVDLHIQTYSPPSSQASLPSPNRAAKPTSYRSISIVSPASEETLQGSVISVPISAQVDPGLQKDHRVRFEVDGQPQGPPGTALSIVIREVPRGAHSVSASIVGSDGAVILQSAPITFYVQQPSILSPARNR